MSAGREIYWKPMEWWKGCDGAMNPTTGKVLPGGYSQSCEIFMEEEDGGINPWRLDQLEFAGLVPVRKVDPVEEMENAKKALYAALKKAVDDYGKEGGPWNVPDEPGTWIAMAKEALAKAEAGS